MKLLLDTHVFLWLRTAPGKIPEQVLAYYQDMDTDVFLSMASLWEMQIKHQLGKLELELPLSELVELQCLNNGLQILNIEPAHIYQLQSLPFHHNDPFDRMILAQAQVENLQLVSADSAFDRYGIDVLWQAVGKQ
ncbi:type II toxin-antitoxin system VapC family toxin [Methylomonas rapida]|uniref:Type II toxin-antitoxin system VapC family toxin n=1 Tax=Methylomonas rapida TaxID=2963939 RepID=A0ABY7GND3_9GAMM|nr:type II toxin-antitoxin system VapC family toxin [Methylomonas rapida]WAR46013.1 type II toxin-antitoxin system VapC family toxin [Methylomonas rapida]